jgi:hypothetical protein
LECIYKENTTKYWWENFREEAFGRDGGKDFVLRLKGLNINEFGEREGMKTKNVLA